ncbi:uncharacterized protein LOC135370245 [Ornithodoros turicata]|uniref:uncharacterized protein LOC135370245 n=1 Tax=Ornithodoros turicata TaxID=34597 RepID=UPI0031399253
MNTSGMTTSGIDYQATTPGQSSLQTAFSSMDGKDGHPPGAEKIDLILFRKKKFNKYWSFGFSLRRAEGEAANSYFVYVDKVTADSPADRSQLLPLDVVLSVNSTPVDDVPLGRVQKMIGSSGDQLVLSVMASSVYRLLTTRRDVMGVLKMAAKDTVVLAGVPTLCTGNQPYGLDIADVKVWNEDTKQYTRVFVLMHVNSTPVNNRKLFPGDVMTHVDGASLDGLSKDEVMRVLQTGNNQVTINVVACSPFRQKRLRISKLNETAITDANILSKSTAADIET